MAAPAAAEGIDLQHLKLVPSLLGPFWLSNRRMRPEEAKCFVRVFTRKVLGPRDHHQGAVILEAPPIVKYMDLPHEFPRQESQDVLSKVFVVKVVHGHHSIDEDIEPIVSQLTALNSDYHCDVPLILVGHPGNKEKLEKAAKAYANTNVMIHVYAQCLFPYVDREERNGRTCYLLTQRRVVDATSTWYVPGDGSILLTCAGCMGVHDNDILLRTSRAKEFMLVLNSELREELLDLSILHYINANVVDCCVEIVDASNAEHQVKERVKTIAVSRNDLLEIVHKEDVPDHLQQDMYQYSNSDNMWVRTAALSNHTENEFSDLVSEKLKVVSRREAIELETKATSAIKLFGGHGVFLQVPIGQAIIRNAESSHLRKLWRTMNPTRSQRFQAKSLMLLAAGYAIYHIIVVLLSGFLETKFAGQEKALAWIEGAIWLFLLCVYAAVLGIFRSRRLSLPMSHFSRVREIRSDTCQLVLLGITRFLYTGFFKSMPKADKGLFSGHWAQLSFAHVLAFFVELVGSYMISLFLGFGFLEPLEFAA